MYPIVFSPPNYLGLLNKSTESPCRPVYLYIGLDCRKIILMSNLCGIKYSLVLGFQKCHNLSMQPIFKLFLKALANSKIPDHESLIGFFAEDFTISKLVFCICVLTSERVDGKFKNSCLVIFIPHIFLILPFLLILLLIRRTIETLLQCKARFQVCSLIPIILISHHLSCIPSQWHHIQDVHIKRFYEIMLD